MVSKSWGKAASAEKAISGCNATGVYPFDPGEVPDYAFSQEFVGLSSDTPNKRVKPCVTSAGDEYDDIPDQTHFSEPRRVLNFCPGIVCEKSKPH